MRLNPGDKAMSSTFKRPLDLPLFTTVRNNLSKLPKISDV
jgi:hypothetical protein